MIKQQLPTSPGVYLHKNTLGDIIYIGKAKNLRKRVASYVPKADHDVKTQLLIQNIATTDFIITNNEVEALLLENRLIKKHKPKYNIALKESRRYTYIRVTSETFPRVLVARTTNKKDKFFGPFTASVSGITRLVRELFGLRTNCKPGDKRPCLYYHLGLCAGVCCGKITPEGYKKLVDEAIALITSNDDTLLNDYETAMHAASATLDYETALGMRKRIEVLERLRHKQSVDVLAKHDQDIIGFATQGQKSCVSLISVKRGVICNKKNFVFLAANDIVESFIKRYYAQNTPPHEIIVDCNIDPTVSEYLHELWGRGVTMHIPHHGIKSDLLSLAKKNAYAHFAIEDPTLIELKEFLELEKLPVVIDCFDISNYGDCVIGGACVQYKNAQPFKSNWRLYNIKGDFGQDDFRSIYEAVKRRYARDPLPDLLLIDGGQVQVDFALRALRELKLDCPVRGLAKREETIIFPSGMGKKVNQRSAGGKLLLQIRNATHKFAIGHSRNRFRKRLTN